MLCTRGEIERDVEDDDYLVFHFLINQASENSPFFDGVAAKINSKLTTILHKTMDEFKSKSKSKSKPKSMMSFRTGKSIKSIIPKKTRKSTSSEPIKPV